mgnify:CR=1 FL=1
MWEFVLFVIGFCVFALICSLIMLGGFLCFVFCVSSFVFFPPFFCISVFNFQGKGVVLNIHSRIKEPEKFEPLMRRVILAVVAILVVFAVCSYEAFGY